MTPPDPAGRVQAIRELVNRWRVKGLEMCPQGIEPPHFGWTQQQSYERIIGAVLLEHAEDLEAAHASHQQELERLRAALKHGRAMVAAFEDKGRHDISLSTFIDIKEAFKQALDSASPEPRQEPHS